MQSSNMDKGQKTEERKGQMTVKEAGHKGGQKVKRLVNEAEQMEEQGGRRKNQ